MLFSVHIFSYIILDKYILNIFKAQAINVKFFTITVKIDFFDKLEQVGLSMVH